MRKRAIHLLFALLGFFSIHASAFAGTSTWTEITNQPSFAPGNMLLLQDGTVLAQDNDANDWWIFTPDINGSYVNGTWKQVASPPGNYSPLYYTSAVLPDGKVLVMGGEYNGGNTEVWTNQGAIYDPIANTWTAVPAPTGWNNIGDSQCVVLPSGQLLMANFSDTQMALFNEGSLTWTEQDSPNKSDRFDEEGWTLLQDGSILTCDAINAPNAERLLPDLSSWIGASSTPQSLEDPGSQELGPQVLMFNGNVFAMGATGHTAIYTPPIVVGGTGSWVAGPDFPLDGTGHQIDIADGPACLLPNGNVFCVASPGVFNSPQTFYEYNGTSLLPESAPLSGEAAFRSSFSGVLLVLPNGQVMFSDQSTDVEIYTPVGSPQSGWRPTITNVPSNLITGTTYTVTGTQLNGLSQTNAYGDDNSNASNYPIVRITNSTTNHVFYCRTTNPSTMAVATGSASETASFTLPSGMETGTSTLEVVANGIASTGMSVTVFAPVDIQSVGISPNPVLGGNSTTGTVTLTGAAPADTTINLQSSDPSAPVPSTVTVLQNNSTATFTINTTTVSLPTTATITATDPATTTQKTTNLTVNTASIASVVPNPSTVVGGNTIQFTVTLDSPAASGGDAVNFHSSPALIGGPASALIPAGQTSAVFTLATLGVSTSTSVTFSVSRWGTSQSTSVTLNPASVSSLTGATSVLGGHSLNLLVMLNGVAPSGGATVNLGSANAAVTVPPTVTVPGGASQVAFTATTTPVSTDTSGNVSATLGTTQNLNVTVTEPVVSYFAISPGTITGGNTVLATISLNGLAAAGGTVVNISGDASAINFPSQTTIASGHSFVYLYWTTNAVASSTVEHVTASTPDGGKTVSVTINPAALIALNLATYSITGGLHTFGEVYLSGPAPAGGAVITLSDGGDPNVTLPATVTVPAGAKTAQFSIVTKPVSSNDNVTIQASYGASNVSQVLTVHT